jgi:hypothetical protein
MVRRGFIIIDYSDEETGLSNEDTANKDPFV